MKKTFLLGGLLLLSACTSTQRSMREPHNYIEFHREDFELSEQVTGQARSAQVFGIDFKRLFKSETGVKDGVTDLATASPIGGLSGIQGNSVLSVYRNDKQVANAAVTLAQLPVFGQMLQRKTANFALYDLMQKNQGYDVILYPQYEVKTRYPLLLPIYKVEEVKVTARLGKIK